MMENKCKVCGKNLKSKVIGHTVIIYCDIHGDMLATTHWDGCEEDYNKYDIILLPNNDSSINNTRIIAEIANCNFLDAKKMLSSESEQVLYRNYSSDSNVVDASTIRDIAIRLEKANIHYRIYPEFPHKIV